MLQINDRVSITKYKVEKTKPFTYPGQVIETFPGGVKIEAFFSLEDHPLAGGVVLKRGDRFVETYYVDRWYNIFEIHDGENDGIKCWYCNVAQPAVFEDKSIWFVDLALDLLVFPDHTKMVLDEDEFEALKLPPELSFPARQALDELKKINFN